MEQPIDMTKSEGGGIMHGGGSTHSSPRDPGSSPRELGSSPRAPGSAPSSPPVTELDVSENKLRLISPPPLTRVSHV